MKINITKNVEDFILFEDEIKKNRGDYLSLLRKDIYDFLLFSFELCLIINFIILLCTFNFGKITFLVFFVVNLLLLLLFLLLFGGGIYAKFPSRKIEELQIKDNKYIMIKESSIGNVQLNKIESLYETENYIPPHSYPLCFTAVCGAQICNCKPCG